MHTVSITFDNITISMRRDSEAVVIVLATDHRLAWNIDDEPPWHRIPAEQRSAVKRAIVAVHGLWLNATDDDADTNYDSMREAIARENAE